MTEWHTKARGGCHIPVIAGRPIPPRTDSQVGVEMAESFRELVVWQRAVQLSIAVYRLTSGFPKNEQFGLTDQMRRAAVSVASNIAEGTGRSTRGEFVQFIGHARGSICELQTQLVISAAIGYGAEELRNQVEALSTETSRMLNALFRRLKEPEAKTRARASTSAFSDCSRGLSG